MNSKERVECVFEGKRPDRYPIFEHFWDQTIERWTKEYFHKKTDLYEYFNFDIADIGSFDLSAQYPEEIISEDDTYRIIRDSRGVIAKHHKEGSGHTPHWIDTPVKNADDWLNYKKRLVFNDNRAEKSAFEKARKYREKDKFLCLFNTDPYEEAWPVFGQVLMFTLMLDEPGIIKDAIDTWADLTVKCLEYYVNNSLEFDGVLFYGDVGYKNNTLFSPEIYRNIIMPAHKKNNKVSA